MYAQFEAVYSMACAQLNEKINSNVAKVSDMLVLAAARYSFEAGGGDAFTQSQYDVRQPAQSSVSSVADPTALSDASNRAHVQVFGQELITTFTNRARVISAAPLLYSLEDMVANQQRVLARYGAKYSANFSSVTVRWNTSPVTLWQP